MSDQRPSKFWHSQPVTDKPGKEGEIQPKKQPTPEPFKLTDGMEWATMDITKEGDMNSVYNLLVENYVSDMKENQKESFRFAYSIQLLRWALQPPNHEKNWWVGIKRDNKLIAFITAIPITVNVNGKSLNMAEVNFLCVHRTLRAKSLAPLLIQEITRRVHLTDKWQALYTAGHKLPGIITSAQYYHRSLNIEKLAKVGFAATPTDMEAKKKSLFIKHSPLKLRLYEPKDLEQCHALFKEHNKSKQIYPEFTLEEFSYWMKPMKGTVWTYVVEVNGKVLDFVSYYHVSTQAVQLKLKIKIAYLWYHSCVNTEWPELLNSVLYEAQNSGFDCFNALEGVSGSTETLDNLKFARGDGTLFFYLYNWKCDRVEGEKMGMFLL